MQKSKMQKVRKCTDETVIQKEKRLVHITIDGKDIPIGEFVQKFITQTIAGMLSSLKKAELEEGSEIVIKIKYKGRK